MPETDKSIVIAKIKRILSERIPLNGQWNNRNLQRGRKRDMNVREDLEQVFFYYKIDEIKWHSNTGQSVLKLEFMNIVGISASWAGPIREKVCCGTLGNTW